MKKEKKGNIQKMLEMKMNRKDFLIFMGTAFVTVIGIAQMQDTLNKLLTQSNGPIKNSHLQAFSQGPYGGRRS